VGKDFTFVFVKRLNELMQKKGLNPFSLARHTNIPRTTIRGWLDNSQSPNVDYLGLLAKYFKCSADYLLGLENENLPLIPVFEE